ncbi:hypothetical protein O181_011249 [Austropuccinia psidii MF-1]|uniref:Uncharacterized protein n=1 Tax=Austropuccinia psidii MF-1 TaxID=1389203 RepID=A0A9Q3GLN7_9BASI|nr:hypothetical protein [Austropuccinia psidii MF-1]
MNSNYYNSSSSGEFAESSEPVLLQVVNQQYECIRQLEQKIDSHDQNLEALLNKFNLQEDTRNASAKSKGKETQMQRFCSKSLNKPKPHKDSPTNVLANNQNTTLKTPHMQNQILYQQISTSSQNQSPNQLLQSEVPEAFQPTKVKQYYYSDWVYI